jgi:hypothetical protein
MFNKNRRSNCVVYNAYVSGCLGFDKYYWIYAALEKKDDFLIIELVEKIFFYMIKHILGFIENIFSLLFIF